MIGHEVSWWFEYLEFSLRDGMNCNHAYSRSWLASAPELDWAVESGWQVHATSTTYDGRSFALLTKGNVLASLSHHEETKMSCAVYARSAAAALEAFDELFAIYPPTEVDRERVPISFLYASNSGSGYTSRTRNLPTVAWADSFASNYPAATRARLEALAALKPTTDVGGDVGGRLILFHGPPGTGKTSAVRALSSAWREWSEVNYILDPENFFGSSAHYMLNAISDNDHGLMDEKRTRVFVLEDTGELLSGNAKERVGAALGRLLNLADGLLGQGTRTLFVITTNEDMFSLHPAMTRPGRCLANIKFEPFGQVEAAEWLRAKALPAATAASAMTLAELYERVNKRHITTVPTAIGGVEVA